MVPLYAFKLVVPPCRGKLLLKIFCLDGSILQKTGLVANVKTQCSCVENTFPFEHVFREI